MKRTSSAISQDGEPPAKRTASLASWLDIPPPKLPSPITSSDPVTDRQSTFIAFAAPCTNAAGAAQFQTHIRGLRDVKTHPEEADHEMLAWRILAPRPGKSGLGGEEDWAPKAGVDDDSEKGGGAAIRKVLEEEAQLDVVCVVSRYYGGIMLGPVRFQHIQTVARQAVTRLVLATALPPLIVQLKDLDSQIQKLLPPTTKAAAPPPKYDKLTVDTAERLVKAREQRLKLLVSRAQAELELASEAVPLLADKEPEDKRAEGLDKEAVETDGQD